ncbi:MAG: cell division protein FtsQ/DivIB [Chloroflexota bacterium]
MRAATKARTATRARRVPREDGGAKRGYLARGMYAALALALTAGIYTLLTASAFQVAKIEVVGQSALSRDEVAQAAGVQGKNVFTVDRRRVASAVAGLGTLRGVEVTVALPNAVKIRVEEYQPRYVWQAAQASYLVDERGIVLGVAGSAAALPTVREAEGKGRKRGDRLDLAALQAAGKLTHQWPASLGKAPACDYGPNGLSVTVGKWRADLGDGKDLEAKLLSLAAVVDYAGAAGQSLSYVDLRVADRPYFK